MMKAALSLEEELTRDEGCSPMDQQSVLLVILSHLEMCEINVSKDMFELHNTFDTTPSM
jgi:hypothetical protein